MSRENPNAPEDCCQYADFGRVTFKERLRQCQVCGRLWKWVWLDGACQLVEEK